MLKTLTKVYAHLFASFPNELEMDQWREELKSERENLKIRMQDINIHLFWREGRWEVLLSPEADSQKTKIWEAIKEETNANVNQRSAWIW